MIIEPYPKYHESGIEWAGQIPAHWRSGKTKRFAELRSGHTPSRSRPEYWVDCTIPWFSLADVWQIRDGKTVYLGDTKEKISELGLANSAADLLPAGTVIVSRTASVGFSGIMQIPMATTQDFVNWIPGPRIRSKFLLYVFRAMENEFERLKIGSTHKTIYMPEVHRFSTPVPPPEEQIQIAKFLDHETAKIDELIEKQQQLIALVIEKRQAVVSHAVTKGLNPDAPMRDSGVEWLGEIPAHWITCALGKLALDKCDGPFGSGVKSEHYTDEGVRVVRLQNIKMNRYWGGAAAFIDPKHYEQNLSDHSVVAQDVLIAGLGDPNNPVGRACVAPRGIEPAMVKADCFRFRLDRKKLNPEFVALQLSASARYASGKMSNGSTRARIPLNFMSKRQIAYCPLPEQEAIVSEVRDTDSKFEKLEGTAAKTVKLLQERRAALISAAVTGKIDVRNWQPPND